MHRRPFLSDLSSIGMASDPTASGWTPHGGSANRSRGRSANRWTAGTSAGLILILSGCSGGTGSVEPGPQASAPACAGLTGRLPAQVLGQARTAISVTGAASWGDPAIVLRCGVAQPSVTLTQCLDVNGVDWVIDESKKAVTFTTFGRDPAVEVKVPSSIDRTSASGALANLTAAVRPLTSKKACPD